MALGPPQFLSVRKWMNCSHLPSRARTRWVTERIASLSNGSPGKLVRNQTDEMTGSKSASQKRVSAAVASNRFKRKIGNENFFTR